MCANYLPATPDQLQRYFGVAPPDSDYKAEGFPTDMMPLIRLPRADAVPGDRACALGMFGMAPHWAKEPAKLARQTYNARTESVADKPTFRNAFKHRQFCIIPAARFFEPKYETGKAVRWGIAQVEHDPLGIAGIWEHRKDGPNGLPLLSFSMLTINADGDPLMQRFHKPDDEKRMLVILRPEQFDAWLHCPVDDASAFFVRYPADLLVATPAPRSSAKSRPTDNSDPQTGSLL